MSEAYIIRTHDRMTFKSCREKWDIGSKLRGDWEPIVTAKALEVGTAFHAACEVYYDPQTWHLDREVRIAAAMGKYIEVCDEHKKQVIRLNGLSIEVETDFKERRELGIAMLNQYFDWAKKNDNFTPVATEIEFEVPIPVPEDWTQPVEGMPDDMRWIGINGRNIDPAFTARLIDGTWYLYYKGLPVVYQGRVDALLEDESGYWVHDYKTAAQAGQTEWLQMDDQIGSYVWALRQMLHLPIRGFIYTEVFKKILHEPKVNQNGRLSVNKQQDTTLDMFLAKVEELGQDPESYADYIEHLKNNPKMVARRFQIHRGEKELEIFQRRLVLEVIDMLNDPSIYPNPSKINCNGCWYYAPCLARQEGSDPEMILSISYQKRSEQKKETPVETPSTGAPRL